MPKYIAVIGGVISGVGKGIATASIGRVLKNYGLSVTAIKIDPYINCDAGTLRPTEHGEVWVTDDGGEIDQDLGNYERFLGQPISKFNNITTGQIYRTLIEKERRGDFLGETVQFIPHVPNEIKRRVINAAGANDIVLVEIGGTIGDYENIPFLFALKSLENEIGTENIIYILVSYLPIPTHIEEMKTKPTQLAIKLLRENGIQPDFIICRGKYPLDAVRKNKIEQYSNISSENIISMPDVTGEGTPNTIYVVPSVLERENLGEKILQRLNVQKKEDYDSQEWNESTRRIIHSEKKVKIGIVGKYINIGDYMLKDSYISVCESLRHAGGKNNAEISICWIDASSLEDSGEESHSLLSSCDGLLIPGGFGSSGVEGKIKAIRYARENNIPFLGLCLGMQLAVVEFARNVCSLGGAHSREINPDAQHGVIDFLPEQHSISLKGGTMRLGSYPAVLKENTKTYSLYGQNIVAERHRHRYEVNPEYHSILQQNGLIFSGMSPDKTLVEFIELPNHPFFIATQSHPEFKSSLLKPAPLFDGFIKASLARQHLLTSQTHIEL
ncbi:CTP synthase [Candidatus Pacearchaeota archaeon]|nr:CTP synthase [Candidatus Pacearchaeota archaeon]